MRAAGIVTLVAAATLAFGAVYPWAYVPMYAAAAVTGAAGLWSGGLRRDMRPLAAALTLLCGAVAAQLIPLPVAVVAEVSPATSELLGAYNVAFAGGAAEWVPLSVDPARTRVALLALAALSLYLVGLPALLDPRQLRTVPVALAVFAVPFALFGIYTRQYNNGLIYGFWLPLDGGGSDQVGPFVNRNHFAGWMLMTLCVMIGAMLGYAQRALTSRRARTGGLPVFSGEAQQIVLMGLSVLIAAISLFWTLSRSAILGCAAAALALVWLARTRTRPEFNSYRVATILLGVTVAAAVAWRGPAVLAAWFQDERSLAGRLEAWRDGWTVITSFPLFGTGLNTYPVAMLFYQTGNPGWYMAQAHNDYVQLLAEGGLLVAVPAVVAVIVLVRTIRLTLDAARSEARGYWIRAGAAVGLLGIAIQEIFEFSLQIPADALLFATLAAIAVAPVASARAPRGRSTRDTIRPSSPRTDVSLS